jgi:hypothetical protein
MTFAPRTTFVANKNPFTGENMNHVDPSKLKISDDPLPAGRAQPDKYADLWKRIKPGQCVVCAPEHTGKIANAMRKHVRVAGLNCIVRMTNDYGDGRGRVWMLANPKAIRRAA